MASRPAAEHGVSHPTTEDPDLITEFGSVTVSPSDAAIPEEGSLIITPEDAAQVYAPPAHLAARFYKLSARRKSSATSSRRNSLSSAHSHGSSGLSKCQSNYVAQHLRRASIIESRKARLADRAAHAEQVRLRAALAKAAPRSNSTSEEKALAAQVAKEKYLARVAAACAEEVAKAKRIAEEVKERKLEEERRQRLEIEERHAEAERRRAEHQRNLQARRARRAESTEKKLAVLEELVDVEDQAVADALPRQALTEDAAARRIQRAWVLRKRRKPIAAFARLNVNRFRARNTNFEEMTALIADSNVIAATTDILLHLGLQDKGDSNATLNTKTFLSAFLIIGNPVAVLNNKNGAQEQDVMAKATDMLAQFEAIIERLAPWNNYSPNAIHLESLSQAYTSYTSAFAAWRLQDSSVLIEGMVASFVELDAIWQTVKDDTRGEVANDYRQGIRDNQVMLLSRIRKLAGPDRADVLIKKAIRESRRRRPKKRAAAEVRPRGAEARAVTGEAGPSEAVDEPFQAPPESLSGELSKLFTNMPSNRVLTHELAVDPEFKLDDNANAPLRDAVYRAVCDQMKHGFHNGQGALWTVSAAQNIREKLLRMLKAGKSMHTLISDTLDLDDIRRQCEQGVFSYIGFFNFMANILPKLCAPFRDKDVSDLAEFLKGGDDELDTMIEKLFRLLRTVDLLSLDFNNFLIMGAAPHVLKDATGYEQRQFAKDLDSGVVSLDQAKSWYNTAHRALMAEASRRDPDGLRPEDRPSPQMVYVRALVDLGLAQGEFVEADVPATLDLDRERLRKVRANAVRITVIGAIMLTAKNLLKRDVRSQWKPESTRLWSLLKSEGFDDVATAQKACVILESAHNMPPNTRSQVGASITRFFAQAAVGRFTDPVLKILLQRLKAHVFGRLTAVSSSERVRAASSASEALASCGLAEFTTHVGAMVDILGRIAEVDWKSHGIWYEQMAHQVRHQ